MHYYTLFNHAASVSFQGLTLEFCAENDAHAIELGKGYAKMLGWEHYSVLFGYDDSDEEVTLYSC